MSDIVDLITSDHDRLRRQWTAMALAGSVRDLRREWYMLKFLVERHGHAEESLVYPLLVEASRNGATSLPAGVDDHRQIRDAIIEADKREGHPELFVGMLRRVRSASLAHMAEEEQEVIPFLRAHTDEDERHDLGRSFRESSRRPVVELGRPGTAPGSVEEPRWIRV
jgi:hemerythrin superfamily protein